MIMMRRIASFCSILVLVFALSRAEGRSYYALPGKGKASNPGTRSRPWGTLQEAAEKGNLSRLKGGDRVLLGSGYHGHVKFGGDNRGTVVIEPVEKGEKPELGRLTVTGGSGWTVKGLAVSPSCGGKPYEGYIVTLAEGGASKDIVIEDCFVYTTEDASKWGPKQWMNTNSGIFMGRHGKHLALRNNYVLNTRFGIALCAYDSLCEGNVVSDFSADGIRVTRDGITVQYNVIKNIYVRSEQGDKNHDDAIQCFLFNRGTGTVRNVTVRYNLILNQESETQPLSTTLQAIGFFDGPLVNFHVEGNVVAVKHWHGVSLYDAQSCVIKDNVVFNPWGGRFTPWVMLGSKQNKAHDNTVTGNYAHAFKFEADGKVRQSDNKKVTKKIFLAAQKRLLGEIVGKFGLTHPVAGYGRLGVSRGQSR
jgi:hypothetical protein